MDDVDIRKAVLIALHDGPDGYRSLVRDFAIAHPDVPARELEMALQAAARDLDRTIRRQGQPTDEARTARRLALMLGVDLDRHGGDRTMGELLAIWRERDDFFLRL